MAELNPSLISNIGTQAITNTPSPFEQYEQYATMRQLVEQQAAQKQLGQNGFNSEETLSYLAKFDPEAAMKASSQSRIAAAQEAKYGADTKLQQMKQAAAQIDTIAKVASGITDQATYMSGLQYLRSQGVDTTGLPANYDPTLVKSKADMALTAGQKLNAQIQQFQAENTANYQQGLLGQGQQRLDTGIDATTARLDETNRHNQAMEQRGGMSGAKSNKRVIERNGSIYIVDPETNVVSEGVTAEGKAYRSPNQRSMAERGNQILTTLQEAKSILQKGDATSGYVQDKLAGLARGVNVTTEGMKDAAKLKNLSAWLTANTPRMEGPQSDKDVKLYAEMSGMLGDEQRTIEERRAAFSSVVQLMRKYKDLNK